MDSKKPAVKEQNIDNMVQDILYHFSEWLKRLWIIILVLAVVGSVGLSLYTYYTYVPSYSASATFTVNVDVGEASSRSYNKATAQQLAKTFPNILTSSSLIKVVCDDLGVDHISAGISASVLEDTNLFTITVTDSSPQGAYDVLQSVMTCYPDVARFVIGSTQLTPIDTSAISTMPTNLPNYSKKALIGALAGGFAGLVLVVLLAMMTKTVIRGSDIRNDFNVSCLGSVAELSDKKRSGKREHKHPDILSSNINYKFREGMYTVRNNVIRKCNENGYRSIVVTSTVSGEGKSIIALNLARAIALKGYRTCLVDYDLRIPSIAGYADFVKGDVGITDYIRGDVQCKDIINKTPHENMFVVAEMNDNPDASQLVSSDRAKQLISELCEEFEFVIIDSPPSGYISDSSVIGDFVDAAVYVVAQDTCSVRSISKGLSVFDNLNAEVLGCVLNRITKGIESANYGKYSYRRYGKYGRYGRYANGYKDYGYNKSYMDTDVNTAGFNGVEFEKN